VKAHRPCAVETALEEAKSQVGAGASS